MKIKLTNSFHGTEAYVLTSDGRLSARQVKAVKKKLCPYPDCKCSGRLGTRECEVESMVWIDGTAKLDIRRIYLARLKSI